LGSGSPAAIPHSTNSNRPACLVVTAETLMERILKPLLLTLLLIILVAVAHAALVSAQDRIVYLQVDRARYAAAWNEIEASVKRYNEARKELGENLTGWPPWLVVSEPKELRRRELYDAAIREAETQARLYHRLRDEDR